MISKHVSMVKLEITTSQQKPYVATHEGIALVFWGIMVLGGLFAIVIFIAKAITKRSRKLTPEQHDKRARIVAARHKYLSDHDNGRVV